MTDNHQQLVVLLHGIARTSLSMRSIEKNLAKQGYATLNIHYPSRSNRVDNLASFVYEKIMAYPEVNKHSLHFVTHSMGGIIVRALLNKYELNARRVVMLGPPNHGSEVADFIHPYQPFKGFYGPALAELTTVRAKSEPFPMLPPGCEVGIIAGNLNLDPICYFILPKGHDGKVTIKSTELPNMQDHLILPTSHSFMMYNKEVIKQIAHFLATGRFLREDAATKISQAK